MTWLAEKKVESRVQSALRARDRTNECVPRPFEITDWRETAVARFFSDYCVGSDAVPQTWRVLQVLCNSSDASACLRDALHATAFVSQANQLGLEWMALKAIDAYGRALASLAKVLQDPIEVLKDTSLATPYLIGQYEVRSIPGLPYTNFENREADYTDTGYQWLSTNWCSHASSLP